MGKSKKRPRATRVTRFSAQEAMRRSPLPFAIARGAERTLVYTNSAFCRLAGIADKPLRNSSAERPINPARTACSLVL